MPGVMLWSTDYPTINLQTTYKQPIKGAIMKHTKAGQYIEDGLVLDNDDDKIPAIADTVKDEKLDAWAAFAANSDFVCKVYREIEEGKHKGKHELCFSFSPVDYTSTDVENKCLHEYGGGMYFIKGYEKNRLRLNESFCVAQGEKKSNIADELRALVPVAAPANDNMMMMMFKMQQDAAQRQTEMMMESSRQNQALLTTLLPLLLKEKSTVDPVALMVQLKQLEGEKESPVAMLLQGMQLAREMNGGESVERESNTTDLFRDLVKTFGQPIAQLVKAQALPTPQPQPRLQNNQQEETVMPEYEKLKANVAHLVSLAERGADIESTAALIESMLNDEEMDKIIQFLEMQDYLEHLALIDGRVKNHGEWFDALKMSLLISGDDEQTELTLGEDKAINLE